MIADLADTAAQAIDADKAENPVLATGGASPWIKVALAACLGLLVAHAGFYWFLTDDAYISFRYARNLAGGEGLVFNPGWAPVEGYTNFLWVLLLAGFAWFGLPPESLANVLSLLASLGLVALVIWFCWRDRPSRGLEWLLLVPPLFLACTRSFAVWCTSGLETRLFELLVVAGVLRIAVEVQAARGGARLRAPVGGLLLALATLTRPDGLLISVCVLGAQGVFFFGDRPCRRRFFIGLAAYLCVVLSHLIFRRLYYGAWLPNTFYAKAADKPWWSMGAQYMACLLLEYGAVLWLPLVLFGVLRRLLCRRGEVPLLFAVAVLPHLLYVVSIGGDHFEYRPLNLYFPFAFLLLYDGALHLTRNARRAAGVALYLVLTLAGLTAIPFLGHLHFPDWYAQGFPGITRRRDGSDDFVSRRAYPILFRLPLSRHYLEAYNFLMIQTSRHYVGLRQEEHKAFLATVEPEGKLLARLIAESKLPADMHVAVDAVGAIPYYSDLRTLDRVGLTDREVARRRVQHPSHRMMAHDKYATRAYAEKIGVDVWAADAVHLLFEATDLELLRFARQAADDPGIRQMVAPAGDDHYLLAILPHSGAPPRPSVARLGWVPLAGLATDPGFLGRIRLRLEARLRDAPNDARAHHGLGVVFKQLGDRRTAAAHFHRAIDLQPDFAEALYDLAGLYLQSGQRDAAVRLLRRATQTLPAPTAETQNELGRALAESGDLDAAAEQFEKALLVDPSYHAAHINLANILARRGHVNQAVKRYERAIELQPYDRQAYLNLATVLSRARRHAEAVAYLRRGVAVLPGDLEITVRLAWLLATVPDASVRSGQEAVRMAKALSDRTEDKDPRVLGALAAAWAEVGRFDDAVHTAAEAVNRATALNHPGLAEEIQEQLAEYRAGRPFRLKTP